LKARNKGSEASTLKMVLETLAFTEFVPEKEIKVQIKNGVVFLDGEVECYYEKEEARKCIQNLKGVKQVINRLIVKENS